MCGFWGVCGANKHQPPAFLKEELSFAELKKIIDEVSRFRPNITLFGGEPLLYKDWLSLVSYIKQKRLRCNIVTNGTLLKDKAHQILDSRLDEIIFSLEGPKDIHDKITQVNGSFDSAITGLSQLKEEKKRRSSNKPSINIACTISEDNYRYLEEIITIGSSIGADSVTFHHLCFINTDILVRHNEIFKRYFGIESDDWSGFVRQQLPNIDTGYLISRLQNIQRSAQPLDISIYPNFTLEEIKRYYTKFDFKPSSYAPYCLSPWMTVYIFPDGSVRPCEELNIYFGNIKNKSFKDIWNSLKLRRFRQILKKEKMFPVCPHCTELYRF
jgi:radical SAM protein with 4Fe4S-binding SPASM domain